LNFLYLELESNHPLSKFPKLIFCQPTPTCFANGVVKNTQKQGEELTTQGSNFLNVHQYERKICVSFKWIFRFIL